MGIWTAVLNGVVQGGVIAPLVYGRAVSLHPAMVLIVIPAGGELAGILGMFLAVPLVGIASGRCGATSWPPSARSRPWSRRPPNRRPPCRQPSVPGPPPSDALA